ncbi:hypothetical protein ACHAWF_006040 [Thalassiosira exigua]
MSVVEEVGPTTLELSPGEQHTAPTSYAHSLKDAVTLSVPIALSEIFDHTQLIDLIFIGWLNDKDDIAAASLAIAWFNLWDTTFWGFMTAIDTLLAQAEGTGQAKNYAICTGNSLVIVFFMTFVVAGLMALCAPIMKLVGQDPSLANEAGGFVLKLIPGLFPMYLNEVLRKFMRTQDHLAPIVWLALLGNGVKMLLNWLLIFVASWGIDGAAWATSMSHTAMFLLTLFYLRWKREMFKETLPIFSMANMTWTKIKPFWKLGFEGALSGTLDDWSFEITTLLASRLGTVAISAHSLMLRLMFFTYYCFAFPIGIAASTRVGQLTGSQKPRDAKISSRTFIILISSIQTAIALVIFFGRDAIAKILTNEEDIRALLVQLMPIACVFMIPDAAAYVFDGIFTGLAKQKIQIWTNLIGYWVLAVPVGAALAFATNLGIYGLWWGLCVGVYSLSFVCFVFYFNIDWEKESKQSIERIHKLGTKDDISDIVLSESDLMESDQGSLSASLLQAAGVATTVSSRSLP